ncbi:hypothetical protein ACWCPT_01800 [Streptomyces sp. NPDC002308]
MTHFALALACAGSAALCSAIFLWCHGRKAISAISICAAVVATAAGLTASPQGAAPAVFVSVVILAFAIGSWRQEMMDDFTEREDQGMPPLMKRGSPYVRGLFDMVWVIRYYRRTRKSPLG